MEIITMEQVCRGDIVRNKESIEFNEYEFFATDFFIVRQVCSAHEWREERKQRMMKLKKKRRSEILSDKQYVKSMGGLYGRRAYSYRDKLKKIPNQVGHNKERVYKVIKITKDGKVPSRKRKDVFEFVKLPTNKKVIRYRNMAELKRQNMLEEI